MSNISIYDPKNVSNPIIAIQDIDDNDKFILIHFFKEENGFTSELKITAFETPLNYNGNPIETAISDLHSFELLIGNRKTDLEPLYTLTISRNELLDKISSKAINDSFKNTNEEILLYNKYDMKNCIALSSNQNNNYDIKIQNLLAEQNEYIISLDKQDALELFQLLNNEMQLGLNLNKQEITMKNR